MLLELFAFMKARKKFWLIPILTMMLLLGALIVFGQSTALAPFIYSMF